MAYPGSSLRRRRSRSRFLLLMAFRVTGSALSMRALSRDLLFTILRWPGLAMSRTYLARLCLLRASLYFGSRRRRRSCTLDFNVSISRCPGSRIRRRYDLTPAFLRRLIYSGSFLRLAYSSRFCLLMDSLYAGSSRRRSRYSRIYSAWRTRRISSAFISDSPPAAAIIYTLVVALVHTAP